MPQPRKEREKIRELTGPKQCFKPVSELVDELNEHLAGWKNLLQGWLLPEGVPENQLLRPVPDGQAPQPPQSTRLQTSQRDQVYAYLNQLGVIQL